MGTWGIGVFENDTALDWAATLDEATDSSPMERSFRRVVESGDSSGDACDEALAAALVVVALGEQFTNDLPEQVEKYAARAKVQPNQELIRLAVQAVQKVKTDSELRDLIADAGGEDEWLEIVNDLENRLSRLLTQDVRRESNRTDNESRRRIHQAIGTGDVEEVRAVLGADPQAVHARSNSGQTPLHHAAMAGRDTIVEFLLKQGADVNARETGECRDVTPICHAAAHCSKRVMEMLIEHGAKVRKCDATINGIELENFSPMHRAAGAGRVDILELLLSHGADIHAGECGILGTPLHYAIKANNKTGVEWLLTHGANPLICGFVRCSPFEGGRTMLQRHSLSPEQRAIADLLVAYGEAYSRVFEAVQQGSLEKVHSILDEDPNAAHIWSDRRNTPLHVAVGMGHNDIAECLLACRPDVNSRTLDGETILTLAVDRCSKRLVELILKHGAEVNAPDAKGSTALRVAALVGRTELAEVLLQSGADPNIGAGTDEGTPLHIAVGSDQRKPNRALVELLLAHGADVRLKDAGKRTPLDQVTWQLQQPPFETKTELLAILRLLKDHGA